MLTIHFAPLQGCTDHVYRRIHHELIGGVDAYYTPFLRLEKDGIRNRDLRDVLPANNEGLPVIPQVIASNRDELCHLSDTLQNDGYRQININMGCSFPLQTRLGRGAGVLNNPDRVQELMEVVQSRPEVSYSVKMRLGMGSAEEGLSVLPLLNEAPLVHVAIHARLGRMQFRGEPDRAAFAQFAEHCTHPVIYNGDVTSPDDIRTLEQDFPTLHGVMVGRGLLARPTLGVEYANGKEYTEQERIAHTLKMHDALFEYVRTTLQGGAQQLSRLQAFWEYQEPALPRKIYKKLMKAGSLITYDEAIGELRSFC